MILIVYELPHPLGYNTVGPTLDDNDNDFDRLYERRTTENSMKARAYAMRNNDYDPGSMQISTIDINGEKYLHHEGKGYVLKETKWIAMVRDYGIPIYEDDHVHFKDVLNQCIKNVFERNQEVYKPNFKINRQIDREWKKKYNLNKNK